MKDPEVLAVISSSLLQLPRIPVKDRATRWPISEATKLRLYEKQEGFCVYCNQHVSLDKMTVDHSIPIARGGRSVQSNLVLCCAACNHTKGWLTAEEFNLIPIDKRAEVKKALIDLRISQESLKKLECYRDKLVTAVNSGDRELSHSYKVRMVKLLLYMKHKHPHIKIPSSVAWALLTAIEFLRKQ